MTDAKDYGESLHRLASLLLIMGGFLLAGSWVLYNQFQIKPDLPTIFNYLVWSGCGVLLTISSGVIWLIGHWIIIGKIKVNVGSEEQFRLKVMLKDMVRGFPSWWYSHDYLRTYISTEEGIDSLIEGDIIRKRKNKSYPYALSDKGLRLLEVWESEKISKRLLWLTLIIGGATVLATIIAPIIQCLSCP